VDAIDFPNEGHGFVKREHQQDEISRALAWLQKYLQSVHGGSSAMKPARWRAPRRF